MKSTPEVPPSDPKGNADAEHHGAPRRFRLAITDRRTDDKRDSLEFDAATLEAFGRTKHLTAACTHRYNGF